MKIQSVQNNTQNNKQNVHFKQIHVSPTVVETYGDAFVNALKAHPVAKQVDIHIEAPYGSFNMTGSKKGWFQKKIDHEPLSVGKAGEPGYVDVSKKENVTVEKVVNRIKELVGL